MLNQNNIILFLSTALIVSAPPILVKEYLKTDNEYALFAAIIFNIIVIYFYCKVFASNSISVANTTIRIISILMVIGIGLLYFKDSLSRQQILGILLSLIAIYFITIK
jgi:drug/metabolite transporter (DMT)-like permease